MRRTLHILIVSIFVAASIAWTVESGKAKPKPLDITGKMQIVHDYCGGARVVEEDPSPKPYPAPQGTTLYVRRGGSAIDKTTVIDSVTCDTAGNFKMKLAPGTYGFYEKWKTEHFVMPANTQFETWDTACYRYNYNKPDFQLTVKAKMKDVKITLYRHCSWSRPCCQYHGPLPPGAAPTNRNGNQPGHQE